MYVKLGVTHLEANDVGMTACHGEVLGMPRNYWQCVQEQT